MQSGGSLPEKGGTMSEERACRPDGCETGMNGLGGEGHNDRTMFLGGRGLGS